MQSTRYRALIGAGVTRTSCDDDGGSPPYDGMAMRAASAAAPRHAAAAAPMVTATPTRPAISSTKALTGHGLSLAGAMEAGFCALAMKEGFMPGSAHITKLDPACEGLNIIRATLPHRPQTVLSNSSGFGGANVALVFKSVN